MILGAIPIVRNASGLWPLYRNAPVFVLDKWTRLKRTTFLNYEPQTMNRRIVLAQFWFDKVAEIRRNYFRKRNSATE